MAAIGNFDGVHLGHQKLLERVKNSAKRLNCASLVITFEPQPLEFFLPEKTVPRLTKWREKFSLLSESDIDNVLVVRFNQRFSALTAEAFCSELLFGQLGVKHIIVGNDFRFGAGREGDTAFLEKKGKELGFTVEVMPSVMMDGERISSTRVREALAKGDHVLAERLLGRPYSMMGRVVYGHQRGRIIGFPTANIYLHRARSPVQGVYAVRLYGISDEGLPGVANVGIRPTVGGTRALLEVHLFDFNATIYGKTVRVAFCKKLRDEKRFANLDLLKEQIMKDAIDARSYFDD